MRRVMLNKCQSSRIRCVFVWFASMEIFRNWNFNIFKVEMQGRNSRRNCKWKWSRDNLLCMDDMMHELALARGAWLSAFERDRHLINADHCIKQDQNKNTPDSAFSFFYLFKKPEIMAMTKEEVKKLVEEWFFYFRSAGIPANEAAAQVFISKFKR